jgi:hypothetical protein
MAGHDFISVAYKSLGPNVRVLRPSMASIPSHGQATFNPIIQAAFALRAFMCCGRLRASVDAGGPGDCAGILNFGLPLRSRHFDGRCVFLFPVKPMMFPWPMATYYLVSSLVQSSRPVTVVTWSPPATALPSFKLKRQPGPGPARGRLALLQAVTDSDAAGSLSQANCISLSSTSCIKSRIDVFYHRFGNGIPGHTARAYIMTQ